MVLRTKEYFRNRLTVKKLKEQKIKRWREQKKKLGRVFWETKISGKIPKTYF